MTNKEVNDIIAGCLPSLERVTMAAKLSDRIAKVQKAVNEINEQAHKIVLDDPLVCLHQWNVVIMYIRGFWEYSVVVDRQEIGGNTDRRLINLLKTRLIDTLLDVKLDLEQNLEKLGYRKPQIEHIQGL